MSTLKADTLTASTTNGNVTIQGNGSGTVAIGDDTAVTGNLTATGTVEPAGDTSASDNAAIGYTAAEGLILTGQGSTNDVTIKNDADADVLEIPTGTTNVTVVGSVTAASFAGSGSGLTAGTTPITTLDIDGGTDINADLQTTDLIIVDDGAGGTNRKSALSRINTLVTDTMVAADQAWTGSQRATFVTDNDGSFDMNAGQNFAWTPAGTDTLEFTNETNGQSGLIYLDNSGGHTISLGSEILGDEDMASTISEAGQYLIGYVSPDGTNVAVSYSQELD